MTEVVDEAGHPVGLGQGGLLVIQRPFPSLLRTLWNDPDRFLKTYFPEELGGKTYLAGDSAHRDKDGYFWIMGRIDDVLNVSGHRLGTMEIESALVAHPLVAEAAVVGVRMTSRASRSWRSWYEGRTPPGRRSEKNRR